MRYRLYVLGAALLFSTGGAAIKATTLGGWQVAGLRSLIAALAILLFLPESRRGWTPRIWLAGVFYALTLIFFAVATKLTTSANAIFLQSTAPLYLLAIGPLFLKERATGRDIALAGAVAAGMSLFFLDPGTGTASAPDPATGNLLGAASGLTWALTIAFLRGAAQGGNTSIAIVAAGNLLAFLLTIPVAWPIPQLTPLDAGVLLYLGIVQIGLAYFLLTRGVRHVPAFEASALVLLEPAMNPVWTLLLHGERPHPWSVAGGAVILVATFAHAMLGQRVFSQRH